MNSTMMVHEMNVCDFIERAGKYFKNKSVHSIVNDGTTKSLNYGRILKRSRQIADFLNKESGLEAGSRIATISLNHHWHFECYFGIPGAGMIMHTINMRLPAEEIAFIIENADDKIVFIDDVLLPIWGQVEKELKVKPRIIVIPYDGNIGHDFENFEETIAKFDGQFAFVSQDERNGIAMCYTSGTTGNPKGVVYSNRSMVLHALTAGLSQYMGLKEDDNVLIVTPMFHVNAWSMPYLCTMVGSEVILPGNKMDGKNLLASIKDNSATFGVGVPTIWLGLLDEVEKTNSKLNGFVAVVGGSALNEAMVKRFWQVGGYARHAWGMTETSPLAAMSKNIEPLEDYSNSNLLLRQGVAPPLVEMRIMKENSETAEWNDKEFGEVQVRGNWITGSYFGTDNRENFTQDGWLKTGDIARIDEGGSILLIDRTKDLIKSGGEWISSIHVENLLSAHENISEAAVIGIPHPRWTERPIAFIVTKDGNEINNDELIELLSLHLAKFQIPDEFRFVKSLPKGGTGKVQKVLLRNMALM